MPRYATLFSALIVESGSVLSVSPFLQNNSSCRNSFQDEMRSGLGGFIPVLSLCVWKE